jgi:hypothetical protein
MATKQTAIEPVSNDAESVIEIGQPYVALVSVTGTSPFLFHRWSVEGVDAKSKAAKGSKAKKEDDLESYVYRNPAGDLCIPGEYLRMAIIGAANGAAQTAGDVVHRQPGRWVTELAYAEHFSLSRQTLINWRYRDSHAGRTEAQPGFPRYRRFGRAVRYWLEA